MTEDKIERIRETVPDNITLVQADMPDICELIFSSPFLVELINSFLVKICLDWVVVAN